MLRYGMTNELFALQTNIHILIGEFRANWLLQSGKMDVRAEVGVALM